jgi:hypothetical protein
MQWAALPMANVMCLSYLARILTQGWREIKFILGP